MVVGYSFNLKSNKLIPETVNNPRAGTEHKFVAYRLKGEPNHPVAMRAYVPLDDDDDAEVEQA